MTSTASQPDDRVVQRTVVSDVDQPRAGCRAWIALAVLVVPVVMIGVDNTVLNVALPSISETLGPSGTQLMWIVDVYGLVLAGLLVTMGSLADRFGRRRLLLVGVAGFGVVSAIAAYSGGSGQLIATRAMMGLFGAMLMPSTLALVRNIFHHPDQRRQAIAIWATGFAVGGAAGPVVGGLLLEHLWWGSVLLINGAVVAVLLPLLVVFVPESRDPAPGPIDPPSIVLVLLTMVPFVYAVKEIAEHGVTTTAGLAIVIAVASGVAIVRRQLGRRTPLFDVRLFKRPVFAGMIGVNVLSIVGLIGYTFFATQYLQVVLDMSPLRAALVLAPGLATQGVLGLCAVVLIRRVPLNVLAGVGLGAGVVGFGLTALLHTESPPVMVAIPFALLAGGMGLVMTLASDVIVSAVPPEKAGAASGISETSYELGGALGTAILGSVLTAVYRSDVRIPAGIGGSLAQEARETIGGASHIADDLPQPLGDALMTNASDAFVSGVNTASVVGAIVMLVAAVVGYVALRDRRAAPTVTSPSRSAHSTSFDQRLAAPSPDD